MILQRTRAKFNIAIYFKSKITASIVFKTTPKLYEAHMKIFRRYLVTLLFTLWTGAVSAMPISIGFEYEVLGGGNFDSVTLPPFGSVPQLDPYELQLFDNVSMDFTLLKLVGPGETFNFWFNGLFDVDLFRIVGINESLMLDPTNTLAFPVGITLINATQNTEIKVTPLIKDVSSVPTPTIFTLFWLVIAYFAWSRVKQTKRPEYRLCANSRNKNLV